MPMQSHTESVRRGKSNGHGKPSRKRVRVEADNTKVVEKFLDRIRAAHSNQHKGRYDVVGGIIEEGKVLIEAQEKIGHANGWTAMKEQLAKEFKYYDTKIEDLQKIASNPVLSDSRNFGNLPTSITCLRVLANIKDHERVQKLIGTEINADMTIEQARALDKHPALKLIEQAVKVIERFPDPSPKDWRLGDPATIAKVITWLQGIEAKRQENLKQSQARVDAARQS